MTLLVRAAVSPVLGQGSPWPSSWFTMFWLCGCWMCGGLGKSNSFTVPSGISRRTGASPKQVMTSRAFVPSISMTSFRVAPAKFQLAVPSAPQPVRKLMATTSSTLPSENRVAAKVEQQPSARAGGVEPPLVAWRVAEEAGVTVDNAGDASEPAVVDELF